MWLEKELRPVALLDFTDSVELLVSLRLDEALGALETPERLEDVKLPWPDVETELGDWEELER